MDITKTLLNKEKMGRNMSQEELLHLQNVSIHIMDDVFRVAEENHLNCFLFAGTFLGAVRHHCFIPWDDDIDLCMPISEMLRLQDLIEKIYPGKYLLSGIGIESLDDPFVGIKVSLAGTLDEEIGTSGFGFKRGIGIDIFPIYKVPKTKVGRIISRQRLSLLEHSQTLSFEYSHPPIELIRSHSRIGCYYRLRRFLGFFASCYTKDSSKLLKFYLAKRNSSPFYAIYSVIGFKRPVTLSKLTDVVLYEFAGKKYPCFRDFDFFLKQEYGDDYMKIPPIEKREQHRREKIDFGKY